MTEKFRSLLPPGAFHSERALEQATTEPINELDTNMVRKVKNADDCPAHLLPWLAWEFAVDAWDDSWSEKEKRQVIRDAAYVHQHRGTAGAVRRALSAVSLPSTVVEWWEETPRGRPYTFRIEVYSVTGITLEIYRSIRRQVNKSKNLRSYLTGIDVTAELGSRGRYYVGGALTAWIDITLKTGETDDRAILQHSDQPGKSARGRVQRNGRARNTPDVRGRRRQRKTGDARP